MTGGYFATAADVVRLALWLADVTASLSQAALDDELDSDSVSDELVPELHTVTRKLLRHAVHLADTAGALDDELAAAAADALRGDDSDDSGGADQ